MCSWAPAPVCYTMYNALYSDSNDVSCGYLTPKTRALSVTEKGDSPPSTEGFKAEGTKGQRFYRFHYDYKDSIATRINLVLIRPQGIYEIKKMLKRKARTRKEDRNLRTEAR